MGNVIFLRKGDIHTAPQGSSTNTVSDSDEDSRRRYTLLNMKGWC